MELRETDDPVRGRLLKKSAMHQKQLEEEVKFISDRTQKIVTSALVVGGALALTYVLVSSLAGSPKKGKKTRPAKIRLVQKDSDDAQVVHAEPEAPSVMAQIGAALATQASVFLLSLAKEKLMEYLQSHAAQTVKGDDDASR